MKRSDILAIVPDRNTWPDVSLNELEPKFRELFENRYKAVNMYLDGENVKKIHSVTGVSYKTFSKMILNCLEPAFDGGIQGYRALVPFKRRKTYIREGENPRREGQNGLSGMLGQTLRKYPDIDQKLRRLILKKNTREYNVHEKNIRAKDLHREFQRLLLKAGVLPNQWPFNTKYRGLRSIQKFLNSVSDDSFGRSVNVRGEKEAIAHLSVGTGNRTFISFEEPYDAVELDAYKINAFFSAEFETPEGTSTEVQLERIWFIALIELVSQAILAYEVVYRSEIAADDVVRVIRKAINPPERQELTINGLIYPENGGFPSEVFPECNGAAWGSILLDGALAHLSQAVHLRARNAVGFSINWGPVAHFERRPNIERFFGTLSSDLFMRLPSTTGTNPNKGRAADAEGKAVHYKIRAKEIEQLIAVYIAQYNMTPTEGNSFNSPLEVIKHFIYAKADHFLPRKLPPKPQGTIFIPLLKTCNVRGGREQGRRPYVQYEGVRYTNSLLAHTAALIGKTLTIEVDENDLRTCRAYLEDGSLLGTLNAGGRWYLTKHSLKTRKIINSLVTKKIIVLLANEDPIQTYMDHISQAKKQKRKKTVLGPRSATEAVRISNESGLVKRVVLPSEEINKNERSLEDLTRSRPSGLLGPLPDLNKLIHPKIK